MRRVFLTLFAMGAVFVLCSVLLVSALAQPASAPATTVAAPAWFSWIKSNWTWIAAVLLVVLPAIVSGLKKYGKLPGLVGVLVWLIELISTTTNKNSPGTFKLPFTTPKPPLPLRDR